jgi:nitrite reductase (NADH) large subunit
MHRERLVVVGNGMASLRLLERLTALAPDRFDITVVGAEPEPAYNRVLLSSLLAGEVEEAECRFRDRAWYLRHGIRLITGASATAVDAGARTVAVGGITTLPFDRLVLAAGSTPIRLPGPGFDGPAVATFRDLADMRRLRALGPGARAVVVGGGLLGLEAAYGLARRGVAVTLVHVMDRLMERQLDARAAALVRGAIERLGITVLLAANSTAVVEHEGAPALRLVDGRELRADLVVVAAGVRPASALAAASGLEVGRGILVDEGLQTSTAGVFAIGECAEHRGQCYGLVEPAYAQADVLARRLAGEADAAYTGSLLATSLKVSGVPVVSAGLVQDGEGAERITLSDPQAGVYRKLVLDGGRLVGACLVGDVAHGPWYLDLIRSGADVTAFRHTLMFGPSDASAEPSRMAA